MLSGLVTVFSGKASLIIGGLLTLATWFIWNIAPVNQQMGDGDIIFRTYLPILGFLFLLIGVVVFVASRSKKRKH